jgi:hypothetical protein
MWAQHSTGHDDGGDSGRDSVAGCTPAARCLRTEQDCNPQRTVGPAEIFPAFMIFTLFSLYSSV